VLRGVAQRKAHLRPEFLFLFGAIFGFAFDDKALTEQDLIKIARTDLTNWMNSAIVVGDDLAKVDAVMRGSWRDRGEVHWGGMGNKDIYFLLDDYHQICISIDVGNKVTKAPRVERAFKWMKRHKAELILPLNY